MGYLHEYSTLSEFLVFFLYFFVATWHTQRNFLQIILELNKRQKKGVPVAEGSWHQAGNLRVQGSNTQRLQATFDPGLPNKPNKNIPVL